MSSADAKTWFLLRSGAGESAHNMAVDQALLESCAVLGHPVLRFYSWTAAAASFGYFQKYAEVEGMTHLRPLVRRPTGGGLVPHDADWTYSLAFPREDSWHQLAAIESYRRTHEWVRRAFLRLGVETALASAPRKALAGQCFAGYETSDVLWHGRKIAGAAQRRTRDGLLIQGSVQPPAGKVRRADWEEAFCGVVTEDQGTDWRELKLTGPVARRVSELVANTYSQPAYNRRR